jgi:NAD(P)-dependent dehydrogenase (short-subunit alcohol dehydrogenase family)
VLLKNKVAIVTGAAKGIGLATAERLAREGASILMADLDEKELSRAADLLREKGHRVARAKCDVGRRDDVTEMVKAAEQNSATYTF